jgi:hypothetical protein
MLIELLIPWEKSSELNCVWVWGQNLIAPRAMIEGIKIKGNENDKNSLWDELNIRKTEWYVKKNDRGILQPGRIAPTYLRGMQVKSIQD